MQHLQKRARLIATLSTQLESGMKSKIRMSLHYQIASSCAAPFFEAVAHGEQWAVIPMLWIACCSADPQAPITILCSLAQVGHVSENASETMNAAVQALA